MVHNNLGINVIPKPGEHIHRTIFLFVVTNSILIHTQFNMVGLRNHYIKCLLLVHDTNHHRTSTKALSHLIAYLFEVKYNITFYCPPYNIISPLMDKPFHIFHHIKMHSPHNTKRHEEEEKLAQREHPYPHEDTTTSLSNIESNIRNLFHTFKGILVDIVCQLEEHRALLQC